MTTKQVIDKIKAISIHAPHAYAICMGKKPFEYRNSATKRRGWVLIHSSSSKASDPWFADYGIDKKIAKRGAIIGAAFIADCIEDFINETIEGEHFQFHHFAYKMTRVILFDEPIEGVKGCQSVFWGHTNDPLRKEAFEAAIEQIAAKVTE